MTPANALETVVGDQKRWSGAADALKSSIEWARWLVLWFSVLGAILETLAAQMAHVSQIEDIKTGATTHSALAMALGYFGAATLAMAAVVRQWRLGHERTQAWVLCRSGSESLKREMYRFRTQTGPYASAGSQEIELLNRRDQILDKLTPYQGYATDPQPPTNVPGALDAAGYLDERIMGPKGQLRFYADRSNDYAKRLQFLNRVQMFLAILGALLSVAVTLSHNQMYGAWVAVITTISGALGAHLLAQRYQQLTISFRAAAQRLQGAVGRWQAASGSGVGDLVEACEDILLDENQGWIAGVDQK